MVLNKSAMNLFQSPERLELLKDIDRFGEHVVLDNLPQIVVCGDKSSGKSSVLSALSGIFLPPSATRFATEIALRYSSASEAVTGHAFITPAADRASSAKDDDAPASESFRRKITSLDDVPTLLEDARKAMGLGEKSGISRDVLRLELIGNQLPNLTLVDLPGLVDASTNAEDAASIQAIVEDYFGQERSIILVVVSAEKPIEDQDILASSCRFDPKGTRTIGVITKPDALTKPARASLRPAILELASNRNTAYQFTRGWHVVRCLGDKERDSGLDREHVERDLFGKEPWKTSLSHRQLGIASLRSALTKHLHQHLLQFLPDLENSLASRLKAVKASLDMLGDSRTSPKEQLLYLTRISRRFGELVKQALEGDYSDPFFQDGDPSKRLRAITMTLTDDYESRMHKHGHTFDICEKACQQTERLPHSPETITQSEALLKVGKLLQSHRGPELSFLINSRLISELFKDQSKKWPLFTAEYIADICLAVQTFVGKAVDFICPSAGETSELIFRHVLDDALQTSFEALESRAEELFSPYTKSFLFSTKNRLQESLKRVETQEVRQEEDAEVSFTQEAPGHSIAGSDSDTRLRLLRYSRAYYDVALETFIETVVIHGVESCLLSKLPAMFTPDTVLQMDSHILAIVAGESADVQSEREELLNQVENLEDSLKRCQRRTSRFHRTHTKEVAQSFQTQSALNERNPDGESKRVTDGNEDKTVSKSASTQLHNGKASDPSASPYSSAKMTPSSSSTRPASGLSHPPTQTNEKAGGAVASTTTASSLFCVSGSTPLVTAKPTSNLFGSSPPVAAKPTSNAFGSSPPVAAKPTSNAFGSATTIAANPASPWLGSSGTAGAVTSTGGFGLFTPAVTAPTPKVTGHASVVAAPASTVTASPFSTTTAVYPTYTSLPDCSTTCSARGSSFGTSFGFGSGPTTSTGDVSAPASTTPASTSARGFSFGPPKDLK